MTIDERLEIIAQRHAALAETVELLAGLHRDTEVHLDRFIRETDTRMVQLMDAVTRLVRVVENHEHRIQDLEGE